MQVQYRPVDPVRYRPPIGMIGCGGITQYHLEAYQKAGYDVVALCDIRRSAAEQRRDEFFPAANVYSDYRDVLRRDDIEVVDVTTHPAERPPIVRASLLAGKHVLSQKPFVLDLNVGQELVELADKQGVRLAVNQNGRWAPHFSYARGAVAAGLLGELSGVHFSVHWDHTWTAGTAFEEVQHLVLYDYAIHWFDMVNCLLAGQNAIRVFASVARTQRQTMKPPLLGQALIEYEHAQASLAFDADTRFAPQDRMYVTGSQGTISSVGPGNQDQTLTMETADGEDKIAVQPTLVGKWFPDGFHGTMGELLCSIEENRTPTIDAARNLQSLALCFAAVRSADSQQPVVPGSVCKMPGIHDE